MPPISVAIIGAGQRGRDVYGAWATQHPDEVRVVAVVDPRADNRRRMAETHTLTEPQVHQSFESFFAQGRVADACIIATPDRHHFAPAIAALDLGYHVLVEKPMAATLEECVELVGRASASAGSLHVGHVLRFAPFFRTLKLVIDEGRLGEIVSVEHRENVVFWHMAHSFVRGNWSRSKDATPMIVQKCCHDFDILTWNLSAPVRTLSSVGSLFEFRPERAPEHATARCTDPCPVVDCQYDARRIYLSPGHTGWPISVLGADLSPAGRFKALKEGPYGRCVWKAGSDVVDHQTVMMELENGATVTLVMQGHSHTETRTLRYDGTKATLRGVFGSNQEIEVIDHLTGERERVPIRDSGGGHGGGDDGIMRSFLASVAADGAGLTDAAASLESHLLAFSAEEARLTGRAIDMHEIRGGAS